MWKKKGVKGAVQRSDSVPNLKPRVVSAAIKARYLYKSMEHFFPHIVTKKKNKAINDHRLALNLLYNCETDFF